jgi:hypothetical protein
MSEPIPPGEIEAGARALTSARKTALGVEVTTPVVQPNGECVTVLVAPEGDGYVVHDAGLGSMYLTSEGIRLTRETISRLSIVAARYDCQLQGGRMMRQCAPDDVPVSIMLVANASRSAGDMAAEARRQIEGQFRYVLTERVREIVGDRLRENESFKGRSGTIYRVANTILDAQAREPIAFIVPLASRSSVATQFRELFDLQAAFPAVMRESVYDESSDFRPAEDGWVLSQVGDVIAFGDLRMRLPSLLAMEPPQFPLHS